MARAEASIVIKRPVKGVGDYLDDPANNPEWRASILEAEKTSVGPTGVGSTYRGVGSFLGRRLEWTSEVTEFEPYRINKQKIAWGPISLEETHIFEEVEGGTRFTIVAEAEPRGFFRFADPVVVRMYQRELQRSLEQLKDILEAQK